MFKKSPIIISVLLTFLLACVTGCGGNTDSAANKDDTPAPPEKQETLMVYCGAGLRTATDDIAQVFEDKNNVKIEYHYTGSAQNLTQIELTQEGDLYIPGALSYGEKAKEKGFVSDMKNICYHIPVIAVPEGNPAGIKTIADLAKPDVKVVLGDPEGPAIGKTSAKILEKANIYDTVKSNLVSTTATVNEIVTYLSMKQCDASIIWEDNANGVKGIEIIQIPPEQNDIKTVPVCVLNFSEKPELAQEFADFIVSQEGKDFFKKHGFRPIE